MSRHWNAPDVQRVGHRGHGQHGVDFFGSRGRKICGGQAKHRQPGRTLTKREILEEISRAKDFSPKLSLFVILTTAPVDPQLQAFVSEKNQEHLASPLFAVEILFWDAIAELLEIHTDVRDAFYGGLSAEAGTRIREDIAAIPKKVIEGLGQRYTGHLIDKEEVGDEIDEAVARTKAGKPDEAITLLERLKERNWGDLDPRHKYRILANIGHAFSAKEDYVGAASYLRTAAEHQPDDPKAQACAAVAMVNSGHARDGFELVSKVHTKFPDNSFAAAVWVQSAPQEMTFEEIEGNVAHPLRSDGDVSLSLAMRARRAMLLDRAEEYARKALEDVPQSWHVYEELAIILITDAWASGYKVWGTIPVISKRTRIEETVSLLSQALSLLPEGVLPSTTARVYVNRSVAYNLLGDSEKAGEDLDKARSLSPEDPDIAFRYAQLLVSRDERNLEEAIKVLRQIDQATAPPEPVFALAQLLFQRAGTDDLNRARALLQDLISRIGVIDPGLRSEVADTLTRVLCAQGRYEDAIDALTGFPDGYVTPVAVNTLRGMVEHARGEIALATKMARAALAECRPDMLWEDRRRVAILLQTVHLYQDALEVWKDIVKPVSLGPDTGRILRCAHECADDQFIIEFCTELRNNGLFDDRYLELELSKREAYHGTLEAVKVMQDFLVRFPTHPYAPTMRTRLSLIGVRCQRQELIEVNPSLLPQAEDVPASLGHAVVEVLRYGPEPTLGVKYAYELFRRHPHEFDAHMAVIQSLGMGYYGPQPVLTEPAQVVPGVAVRYREEFSDRDEYIILEDSPGPPRTPEERPPSHRVFQALLGKRVGESFALQRHPLQEIEASIRLIQSKYLYRFQDCWSRLAERFPDRSPIFPVHIRQNAQGGPDLTPIYESADKRHKTVQAAVQCYQTSLVPLHIMGRTLGVSVFDTLRGLAAQEDVRVKCCRGTHKEYSDALMSLRTASAIVVDESALFTLFLLEQLDCLLDLPVERIVSEGTVQAIRDLVVFAPTADQDSGVLTKVAGKHIFVPVPADHRKRERQSIQKFVDVVEKVCTVESGVALANIAPSERKQLIELIGQPAAEAVTLVGQPGRILWTDDLAVADVASTLFRAQRVWTQAVAFGLSAQGYTRGSVVVDTTVRLLECGYYWTRLSPAIFMESADRVSWKAKSSPLPLLTSHFAEPDAELAGIAHLAACVCAQAWARAPDGDTAQYLISCILDRLASRPGGGAVIQSILELAHVILAGRPEDTKRLKVTVGVWFENVRKSGIAIH